MTDGLGVALAVTPGEHKRTRLTFQLQQNNYVKVKS